MRLIIIGSMASGKSTVGRKLSKKLGLDFFDIDNEIEKKAGAKISWIFDVEGEEKEPKIIEDPDLGKNKTCVKDEDREFDPSAYDPYDENAYSIININIPETKEYRPKKLDSHANVNVEIEPVEHDHDHANFSILYVNNLSVKLFLSKMLFT